MSMLARGMQMYASRSLASAIGRHSLDLVPRATIDAGTVSLLNRTDNDRSSAFASLAPMLPQTTATPHDAPKRPGIYASAALTSTSPICVVY